MKKVKIQKKYVTMLKDFDTAEIDAIIISTVTTADEIDDIIREAKEIKEYLAERDGKYSEGFNFDDLRECLPEDCEIVSAANLGEVIW
jgi:uncharacterized Zn finger protein